MRESLRSLAKPNEKAHLVPFHLLLLQLHPHLIVAAYYGMTKPTVSLCTDDNGSPCHMDLGLVPASHGPAGPDKLRDASATGTTGDTPWIQEYSHIRTRTRRKTTCLVGHPSIEATHPTGHNIETPSRTPTPRRRFASSLRIAPGHSRLQSSRLPDFQDYQPPTLTTD